MADDPTPKRRRPWATIGLCVVNAAAFVAMTASGANLLLVSPGVLRAFGGVDAGLIAEGQVWRLLTGMFVHGAVWHFGMNLWVLLQVGPVLERMVGWSRYLLIYVVAGIFGFAVSVLLRPGLSVGASGAIFGVTGALLSLASLTRHQSIGRFLISALVPFVIATLALGVLIPIVDNTAHIGGFLMGWLLGYGLNAGERTFLGADDATEEEIRAVVPAGERGTGTLALAAALVMFAVVVPLAIRPVFSPRYHAVAALRLLKDAKLDQAKERAARAERLAPGDALTLLAAGRVLLEGPGDDAHARGRRLVAAALAAADPAPLAAFIAIVRDTGNLTEDPLAPTVTDERTGRDLCDAALAAAAATPDPVLDNACAWHFLRAADPAVHDVARGLALAERAVEGSHREEAEILDTLAEARAQVGDAREAANIIGRMIASGMIKGRLYELRREHFEQQALDQERRAREAGAEAPSDPPPGDPPEQR